MFDKASDLLGQSGPFVQKLEQFSVRKQQQDMADAITDAIDEQRDLVVEAGTGTGKTFAYLVPAICSGKKVIISTGTKNLQDQIFNKDVPLVQQALNIPVSWAVLKGRSNYLCLYRYHQQRLDADKLPPRSIAMIEKVGQWAKQTQTGDIAEFTILPEGDMLWSRLTSTSDNCIGTECTNYKECHVMRARREAQAADIIVVNHHLLLSDMALLEEGFGELLPRADVYIIDEAHQLADVASNFFGVGISSQQFIELASDISREYLEHINESRDVERQADYVSKLARDFRLVFGKQLGRSSWSSIVHDTNLASVIAELNDALDKLKSLLVPLIERSAEIESCYTRLSSLIERFNVLTQSDVTDQVHWYEVHQRSVTIHLTPLNIADAFQEKKKIRPGSWIFTSATLSVSGGFEYFTSGLGLFEYSSLLLESPFNFNEQTLLYLPTDLPEPNHPAYTDKMIDKAIEVLRQSQGRAFFLFTSFRALNQARQRLEAELPYPLLVQGDSPRDMLLEKFRNTDNAILLGTNSFWEGVDVRGESLVCVIIDKLPFAAPNDPVLQARLDALKSQGINPFMQYQLPRAAIMLKQGVGRLIRDRDDYGILMLCDPRIKSKFYGKTFIRSLPEMPQTTNLNDIREFYSNRKIPAAIS